MRGWRMLSLGSSGSGGSTHSPSPTAAVQKVLGDAFAKAFPDKQVLVRHPWLEFRDHDFGGYWDSWGHIQQMSTHGAGLASLKDRWKTAIMGGEVAYDWGNFKEQPGDSPTDTMVDPAHRNFFIGTIRSLHCTQLRWVADYDENNPAARAGAEEVQKAFGYRFVLGEVRYPRRVEPGRAFEVEFDVRNTGSAPFYEPWPVELSLLDTTTGKPVWKDRFADTDVRKWMPGDSWKALLAGGGEYEIPAETFREKGMFTVDRSVKPGEYYLTLAILDPAGEVPSLRLAVKNYFKGGYHPIGKVGVGVEIESVSVDPARFDDPHEDHSLRYYEGESRDQE